MDSQHSATSETSAFGRSSGGPLSGIVIADFGRVLAGPYCTMLLADLGATVIKIESPAGDETRAWRPPVRGNDSTYFLSINRNKTSIKLDLRDPDDRRTAQRIAERADVVVENFKPGDLVRYGLDYDTVAATNKDVVYASITGFGTAGGAQLPGYDLLIQALSGLMDLTGRAGHRTLPVRALRCSTSSPACTPASASSPRCGTGTASGKASWWK